MANPTKFFPADGNVLIRSDTPYDPDATEPQVVGTVISVGFPRESQGHPEPIRYKIGDRVMVKCYHGDWITVDGERLILIDHISVLGWII